nr:MAG TPA: hypothetical protein [Inoviridae sp.]
MVFRRPLSIVRIIVKCAFRSQFLLFKMKNFRSVLHTLFFCIKGCLKKNW